MMDKPTFSNTQCLEMYPVISEVSTVMRYPPGTRLIESDGGNYRYGRAATKLRAGRRVYIGLNVDDKIAEWWTMGDIITEEVNRKLYSSLSSSAKRGWVILGLAVVDVPEGNYCWVKTAY